MSPGSKKTTMNSAAGCLYILHIIVLAVSQDVRGSVNDTLILPCTYTIHKYHNPMCWGRGCKVSGCYDEILKTDGKMVTWKKSDRYQLLGDISRGDVSLTITRTTKEDEGTYCCRVKISGPFNDKKIQVNVKIQEAQIPPSSKTANSRHFLSTTQNTNETDSVSNTPNPGTIVNPRTSFTSGTTSSLEQPSDATYVIPSLVATLSLATLMGFIVYKCKYRSGKTTKTGSTMSVINMEALGEPRNDAIENIYT